MLAYMHILCRGTRPKTNHKRLQASVGSSCGGHVVCGIVTQDIAQSSCGLAHQPGTQVDGVPKDGVLSPDAGPHTRTQQLACCHANAALSAQAFHALHNG